MRSPPRGTFAHRSGESLMSATRWRTELNSNCRAILRRVHPILRQHEQLTLLGPDMALEQTAETVHLVVRAGLDRRGFHPKLAMVAQPYVDQRRFHAQHCAECGKHQFLLNLQMVDQ